MPDLRRRFAELREEIERLPSPDLPPGALPTEARAGMHLNGPSRRLAAAGLALLVAVASTVFVVRAFRDGDGRTSTDTSPTLTFDPTVGPPTKVGPVGNTNTIIVAGGSIWVTAFAVEGGGGVNDSVLFRIDPATQRVVQTIPIRATPSWEFGGYGITVGFDSIWIVGGGSLGGENQAILERVDPRNGAVLATVGLGAEAGAADVDANSQGVWVTLRGRAVGELLLIDPTTNGIVDRVTLTEPYARKVVATDDAVIVEELAWSGERGPCSALTSIDPQTRDVIARSDPFSGPCSTTRLVEWEDQAWGTTMDDRLAPIDPRTALPSEAGFTFEPGHAPRSFLLPTESGLWYAAYPGNDGVRPDRLTRIDPSTGERTEYPLEVGGVAAVMDGNTIWTLNFEAEVTRIDLNPS